MSTPMSDQMQTFAALSRIGRPCPNQCSLTGAAICHGHIATLHIIHRIWQVFIGQQKTKYIVWFHVVQTNEYQNSLGINLVQFFPVRSKQHLVLWEFASKLSWEGLQDVRNLGTAKKHETFSFRWKLNYWSRLTIDFRQWFKGHVQKQRHLWSNPKTYPKKTIQHPRNLTIFPNAPFSPPCHEIPS